MMVFTIAFNHSVCDEIIYIFLHDFLHLYSADISNITVSSMLKNHAL